MIVAAQEKPPLPPKTTKPSLSAFQGSCHPYHGVLLPQAPAPSNLPAPPLPSRKITSPFSWLSRNTSTHKEVVVSPPSTSPERRNTASSVATVSSNAEMMLSKLEEGSQPDSGGGNKKQPARDSLRDRFKLLRMREEAGITRWVKTRKASMRRRICPFPHLRQYPRARTFPQSVHH